jgi:hypothetical protein
MSTNPAGADARQALLMIWTNIPADVEHDFNDWYNREHIRERVEVPGFIRARRFAAISGSPKYLALYEARDADVMRSEPYMRFKRTRDERTLHFTRLFRDTIKATCDVAMRAGNGEGAFLVALPVAVDPTRRRAFTDWLRDDLLPRIAQAPNIAAATYAEHNGGTREAAAAHDVRTGDRHVDNVLLIEATSEHGVSNAIAALNADVLESHGATAQIVSEPCVLRVLYSLHA